MPITVGRGIDVIKGVATTVPGATVSPVTGVQPIQEANFLNSVQSIGQQIASFLGSGGPPFPNELRDFATYNYVFTFGCLNNFEINFPDITYRVSDPSTVVLKSGGNAGSGAATVYESGGKVEYYIDDVSIETIIGFNPQTKQSNATGIDFKVTEPLSMGLFLQSLQVASLRSGHKNYLEAPWVLAVEFKGSDENGNQVYKPGTRRIFPLKLVNIDFEVTEGGSVYNVKAIPWHEQALTNEVQSIKTDLQIQGKTVHELLQKGGFSLQQHINRRQEERKKKGEVVTPDEVVILFPTDRSSATEGLGGAQEKVESATVNPKDSGSGTSGFTEEDKRKIYESVTGTENAPIPDDFDAELSKLLGIVVKRSEIGDNIKAYADNLENVNEIGKSELVESFLTGKTEPFGRPKFVEVKDKPGTFERGKVQISNKLSTLTFKAGTTVQEIVEEIVILSDYGKKIVDAKEDENGMVPWYKVEADVYNITDHENMDKVGKYPKVYVYRVIPFKVHVSKFQPATKSSPGIANLKRQACKKYDYIYTGQNDDILEFNINFDVAFFTAITPFGGANKAGSKDDKENSVAGDGDQTEVEVKDGDSGNLSASGNAPLQEKLQSGTGGKSGGARDMDNIRTSVARDFNDALVNSTVDLVTARMTIWGDPYFIADSGMGNYNSAETDLINLTADGTMDYQSSEVDIEINFRTPLDYSQGNYMDFPNLGVSPVGAFSGVYNIITCTNNFADGQFTQQMSLIRRRNQPGEDTKIQPTTEGNKAVETKTKSKNTDKGKAAGASDTNETIAKGQEAGKGYRGGYGF